jgi:L-arabinose transport system substrate-binding protein
VRRLIGFAAAAAIVSTAAMAQDAPHFFYLNKLGDLTWFVDEVAGAKAEAERLGVEFTSQDLKSDSNLAITALDTAIAAGAAGIVIVVPDQQIGPAVMAKVQEASIPIIAVDDNISDAAGNPAPFVGFSAVEIGKQVGNSIADFATAMNWGAPDAATKLLSVEVQTLSVCMDRTDNAIAVLKERIGLTDDNIVHIAYDPGTQDKALSAVSQAITAYPGVTKWMISSCNDEGVLGSVRALEQAGYTADSIIGVGIGGQLACEEFKKAEATGLKGSMYVDSKVHGQVAVNHLYEKVVNGKDIPMSTIVDGVLITRDDNSAVCS